MIDLRSDTLTVPDEGMREAIASAPVGDDVYGEDPTVNELQDYVAELLGKEAALFVPSGTMGNQLGVFVNTNTGDEVILDADAHIFYYETGAPSILSRVQLFPIKSQKGEMNLDDIEAAIRPDVYYYPKTSLLCLENTHNRHGGTIISMDYIKSAASLVKEKGLNFHCDGARLWNAHAATGISLSDYCGPFNTVSVCLSKGMGAPVGSLLAGSRELIRKALKMRKILGGGMRQAGILAAAGIYALKNNIQKLKGDHENARKFAETANQSDYFSADISTVETNIVVFSHIKGIDSLKLVDTCSQKGLLLHPMGNNQLRVVFHFQLASETIPAALAILNDSAKELQERI